MSLATGADLGAAVSAAPVTDALVSAIPSCVPAGAARCQAASLFREDVAALRERFGW